MILPFKVLRPRTSLPVAPPQGDNTGLMVLVLFALVFVPVLAVHAAFTVAPAAIEDAPLPRHGRP